MNERVRRLLPKRRRSQPRHQDSGSGFGGSTLNPQPLTLNQQYARFTRSACGFCGSTSRSSDTSAISLFMMNRNKFSAIRKILVRISAKGEKTDPAAILALLSKFRNGGERPRRLPTKASVHAPSTSEAATNQPAGVQRGGL